MCLGNVVTSALLACNCLTSLTNCITSGPGGERIARVFHLFFMALSIAAAIFMKNWGNRLVINVHGIQVGCVNGTTHIPFAEGSSFDSLACAGNEAVYRFSASLLVFHLVCGLISMAGQTAHTGLWGLKTFLYLGFTIGSFFIENSFFNVYASAARWLSFIFLVMQVVALIDFAYKWHEDWVTRAMDMDESNGVEGGLCSNRWRVLYIVFGFGMFLTSVVGGLFMYSQFHCTLPGLLISISLIFAVGLMILSLTQLSRGLLSGSAIGLYAIYLCWSALSSYPYLECNPGLNVRDKGTTFVSLMITAFSLCYAAFSLAGNANAFEAVSLSPTTRHASTAVRSSLLRGDDEDVDEDASIAVRVAPTPRAPAGSGDEKPGYTATVTERLFFHGIMAIGSAYVAMLLTDWASGDAGLNPDLSQDVGVGLQSMWVKVFSQWATIGVYLWTVFAPVLMPDRDFS